jgi:serine/threonine-protein kinase
LKVTLTIDKGTRAGERLVFEGTDPIVAGRGLDVQIRFPDDDYFVSRRHMVLRLAPPDCFLADLDSTNGTFLNGERISGEKQLKVGDKIRAGATVLTVTALGAEGPEGEGAPAETGAVWLCRNCRGLAEDANADGRAIDIGGAATYLCRRCAAEATSELEGLRAGPYRLLRLLGQGTMGSVYEAVDERTGRFLALKQMQSGAAVPEKAAKLFQREMAVLQDLRHPNIVRLIDQGVDDGRHYFASEYLNHGDAGSLVTSRRAAVGVEESSRLIGHVLDGLQYAHERNYVHRDIKPQNVLLAESAGRLTAKIADFGLAKNFAAAGASFMTRHGESAGTLLYMAPEQITNFRYVKPAADLYSTGVSFYYLLSGRLPFHFPSPLDRLMGGLFGRKQKTEMQIVLEDEPIPLLEQASEIPPKLAEAVDRSIRKKEDARFQSAAEMKQAIEAALGA